MKRGYLILLLIIIFLIIGVVIGILLIQKNSTDKKLNNTFQEEAFEFDGGNIIEAQEMYYYSIDKYVTKFLNAIALNNASVAYNMLDKNYATENGITIDNINSKFTFTNAICLYETKELYYAEITENNGVYFASGDVLESNNVDGIKKQLDVIINVDYSNGTFSIVCKNEDINKEEFVKSMNEVKIEQNDDNILDSVSTDKKKVAESMFNKYKFEALYYPESAYESLDEECKNTKFQTIEGYKGYITENKDKLENAIVDNFFVTSYGDYTSYRITDNFGNSYIFKVTDHLNYTVDI